MSSASSMIQKVFGVASSDFETLLPSLKSAAKRMTSDYSHKTHPKLKMLDALIVFSLVSLVV